MVYQNKTRLVSDLCTCKLIMTCLKEFANAFSQVAIVLSFGKFLSYKWHDYLTFACIVRSCQCVVY